MNHATMSLGRIEQLLSEPQTRPGATITQKEIREILERSRPLVAAALELGRRQMVHPSELTLVLR